jgi:RNAse (barnase) inhibitor barstar
LDTARIKDWTSFHEVCKEAMGFPDFYGMNMDAWIDCLTYLDKEDEMSKFVLSKAEMLLQIEVTETEEFKSRVPEIFDALVECSAFVNRRYVTHYQHP